MKNTIKLNLFIASCSLSLSAPSFAECPDTLNTEKMVECITVEGSGADYQDWQKNEYELNLETSSKTTTVDTADAGANKK